LLPLASLIDAELNRDYYEGQEKELVQEAIAAQGTVLIAWKHNKMHLIANAILGNKTKRAAFGRSTVLISSGSLTGETALGPLRRCLSSSLPATRRM
jgi:hypothetical protein